MAGVIEGFRWALLGTEMPGAMNPGLGWRGYCAAGFRCILFPEDGAVLRGCGVR